MFAFVTPITYGIAELLSVQIAQFSIPYLNDLLDLMNAWRSVSHHSFLDQFIPLWDGCHTLKRIKHQQRHLDHFEL